MWGNLRGWSIAAIWIVLCCAWLYFLATRSAATPPTAFSADANNFAAIKLPTPPGDLLAHESPNVDAADLYRRAIAECDDHPGLYENFATLGTLSSPTVDKLDAIDLLVKAATGRNAKIFTPHPEQLFNFIHTKPPLESLRILSRVCIDRMALLNQKANHTNVAIKYYQAGFALGWSLCNERLTYDEFQLGEEIISKACAGMTSLLDKTSKADEPFVIRDFAARQSAEIQQHVDPVLAVVRSIDAKVVGPRTGDVFELARRSHERMWRIEAIFATGRIRYFAGDSGTAANQRIATQLLRKLSTDDPDPLVRRAAAIARDLTIEEYRTQ